MTMARGWPSGWPNWRLTVMALAMGLLTGLAILPASADQSREAYLERLDQSIALVERATEQSPTEQRTAARTAALLLSDSNVDAWGVSLAVHHPVALPALEADPPDLPRALALLKALRRANGRAPGAPSESSVDLQKLNEILQRPQFQNVSILGDFDPLGPLVVAIRRAIFEGLGDVGGLIVAGGRASAWFLIVAGLALGVVAALLVFVVRGLRANVVAESALDVQLPPRQPSARSAEQAWHEAQRLAQQGEFRAAIRHIFLSCLWRLDQQGLIRYQPSLTNREHLGRVGDSGLRSALASLVDRYEALWYGHLPCGRPEFDAFTGLATALRGVGR